MKRTKIRTLVILLLFGYFASAQANVEENRYVNLPNIRIRVVGLENEAIKSLPLQFQVADKKTKELQALPVVIDFDESTYEYVITPQLAEVPNSVRIDQISITVENYKPLATLKILEDKLKTLRVAQPKFTLELKLNDADKIIRSELAKVD